MTQTFFGHTTTEAHADLDALLASLTSLSSIVATYPVLTGELGVTNVNQPYGTPFRYGGKGNGTADDRAALAAADAAAAACPSIGFVTLPPGTWRAATSFAFTMPVTYQSGAVLSLDAGAVATHAYTPLARADQRLFIGAGTVSFGTAVDHAYPDWWTLDGTAINKALAALPFGATLRLLPKTYTSSSAVLLGANLVSIVGAVVTSPYVDIFGSANYALSSACVGSWIRFTNVTDGLVITSNAQSGGRLARFGCMGPGTGTTMGWRTTGFTSGFGGYKINNLWLFNFYTGFSCELLEEGEIRSLVTRGCVNGLHTNIIAGAGVSDISFYDYQAQRNSIGAWLESNNGIKFYNGVIQANTSKGMLLKPSASAGGGGCDNVLIEGIWFEANDGGGFPGTSGIEIDATQDNMANLTIRNCRMSDRITFVGNGLYSVNFLTLQGNSHGDVLTVPSRSVLPINNFNSVGDNFGGVVDPDQQMRYVGDGGVLKPLYQVQGISKTSRPANNLCGTVTVTGATTDGNCVLPTPEPDGNYYIFAVPISTTGTPAAGSTRVARTAAGTTSLDVITEVAPGVGNSVTFAWFIIRTV